MSSCPKLKVSNNELQAQNQTYYLGIMDDGVVSEF